MSFDAGDAGSPCAKQRPPAAGGTPVTLVAAGSGEVFGSLAVDGTNVYWAEPSNPGAVLSVPVGGGAPKTLASQQPQPNSISIAGNSVYWTLFRYSVVSVPVGGGVPVTVGIGVMPNSVAADSNNVYFTDDGNGTVVQAPLADAGTQFMLVNMQPSPRNIAVDSTSVYWTSGTTQSSSTGSFVKTPIDGGAISTLVSGPCAPSYVVVRGSAAYYLACEKVMSVPLSGGTPMSIASTANANAVGIAADDTNVYWTEWPNDTGGQCGIVMKVPIGGGASTTLAVAQLYPSTLATDGTSLYWSGAAALMKLSLK
jgi:hypothetical protein